VSDATITVTNLGDQVVDDVFGVIYPPQVALVGFGELAERPWASGGMSPGTSYGDPVRRPSCVRRHEGARFLAAIDRLRYEPGEPCAT
jgi:pyruvate dehydrogenase E2 component (dihydrolipoamide acetyltransferase)